MAAVRDFPPLLGGTRGSDINNNSPFMSQGAAVGVEVTAEAPFSQISTALIPTCRVAVSRRDWIQNSEPKFRYCPLKKGANRSSTGVRLRESNPSNVG